MSHDRSIHALVGATLRRIDVVPASSVRTYATVRLVVETPDGREASTEIYADLDRNLGITNIEWWQPPYRPVWVVDHWTWRAVRGALYARRTMHQYYAAEALPPGAPKALLLADLVQHIAVIAVEPGADESHT